jgi:hypothetical protein
MAKLRRCRMCGRRFRAPTKRARYCSSACRQRAYRRRKEVTHETQK